MLTALRNYFLGRGSLYKKLMMLGEAFSRVSDEYKEFAKQADGELTWYGCGIWLPGIGREDTPKVQEAMGGKPLGLRGWAESVPSRRRCLFATANVQASSPERAAQRAVAEIARRFEERGIENATAVRVEVEELPPEFVEEIERRYAEEQAAT